MLIVERGIETLLVFPWTEIIPNAACATMKPNWVPWNIKDVLLVSWLFHSWGAGVLSATSLLEALPRPPDSTLHWDLIPIKLMYLVALTLVRWCQMWIMTTQCLYSSTVMKYPTESTWKKEIWGFTISEGSVLCGLRPLFGGLWWGRSSLIGTPSRGPEGTWSQHPLYVLTSLMRCYPLQPEAGNGL